MTTTSKPKAKRKQKTYPDKRKTFQPIVKKRIDPFAGEMEVGEDYKPHHKHPSPNRNRLFTQRWDEFIKDIVARPNFKPGHLVQLEILCDLYVEYDRLKKILSDKGYTMISFGRNGRQERPRPEMTQMNVVRNSILSYCKTLGLLLVKDKDLGGAAGGGPDGEEEEFD